MAESSRNGATGVTTRVYLHVGSPKSGTTYLQRILERNRDTLAEAGVLLVGERHLDRIHAAMAVREDPRLDKLPAGPQAAWQRLVDQVRAWKGGSCLISYELFAGASLEQAERALAELEGAEVHVVITSRDLGHAVPSAWQERLKFGLTRKLENWQPPPETAGEHSEWGWRTLDPAGVAARWGATLPPERVHIVTMPRSGADRTELWRRFARACGLADLDLDLDLPSANESLGVVEAELLRRINKHLRPPIEGSREHAVWVRDTLAHGVLAPLGRERIGITDAQFAEAQARSEATICAVAEAGYDVQGDLEDLRAAPSDARLPGSVAESELLESALETIVSLLLLVRERTVTSGGPGDLDGDAQRPRPRALARNAIGLATMPIVRRRDEKLKRRIVELEKQVAADRALHLRVASLQDVVSELLLPAKNRDGRVTAKALQSYRQDSL